MSNDPRAIVRIIRMRMAQRGFKDLDKGRLITFSGTASRLSQRLVVSKVCCRQDEGWRLSTVD
eukprot:7091569-Karenia_brevis.AAC.1